jgi:hypothetical protein
MERRAYAICLTAKAEDIVAKIERCRQRLEEISPGCTKPKRRVMKTA